VIRSLLRTIGIRPDPGLVGSQPRSPRWPSVRAAHLRAHPTCAACGSRDELEVHHVVPYHVDRSRELDPSNLLTLCATPCHRVHGHLMSWKRWNVSAVADAAAYLARLGAAKTRG
jgi:5-methylcytosine-specific restriction protein A